MEQITKYIYEVYKQKSFTAAAKALFISQPALSAAISRFEKENKLQIFDRSSVPITLTPQGRVYIDMIEEMMESESNMQRRMRELSNTESQTLSIGGKFYSSYFLISSICGTFYRQYPDVRVSVHMGNAGGENFIYEKLLSDKIDLLFSYSNDADIVSTPLYTERYIIAMHKDMEGAKELVPLSLTRQEVITGLYDKSREIDDTSIFKDIRFIPFSKLNSVTKTMERLLGRFKSAPYRVFTSRHSVMHYNLMCAGIGAIFTTDTVIAKTHHDSDNILYFALKSEEAYRTIYLLRKQHTNNNPAVNNFIKVAKEVCKPEHIIKPDIYIP